MEVQMSNSDRHKEFKDLTFTDDFMFWKVLTTRKDICIRMLEIILGEKIKDILSFNGQDTMQITPDSKGVRFDVLVDDVAGTVYDIDMQTTRQRFLPRRMRYYQSVIDINSIDTGAQYNALPESKIIFICLYDQFGKGRPLYRFRYLDAGKTGLELGDGTEKIVLNASARRDESNKDLSDFLEYVRNGSIRHGLSSDIDTAVSDVKSCKRWEVQYMVFLDKLREEYTSGFSEGKVSGWKENRDQTKFLRSLMRNDNRTQEELDRVVDDDDYFELMAKTYHLV